MKYFPRTALLLFLFIAGTQTALAVPPPDFLFNVGSQIVQVFSILTIFLSAAMFSVKQYFNVYYQRIKHKKFILIVVAVVIIGASFAAAYTYQQYEQDRQYQEWVAQSKEQNAGESNLAYAESLDVLKINDTQQSEQNIAVVQDKYAAFIRQYYENINNKNFEAAYAVSKKSVAFETYISWYQDLLSISVLDIQRIEEKKYSIRVALKDSIKTDYLGVLMTLSEDDEGIHIADSSVRTLGSVKADMKDNTTKIAGENSAKSPTAPAVSTPPVVNPEIISDTSFYENNSSLPAEISNDEFKNVISAGNVFVLDAREDEEFEIGNFPQSTHIRFADLIAGEWIKLPIDRTIYVFCWSGMRGEETAKYLRSKKILARYIENGADGWVAAGGTWNGGIKFSSKYGEERYTIVFNLDEVKQFMENGVIVVDSRPAEKYNKRHIPDSINIPIIYTPTGKMGEVLGQVPAGKKVITVCDDFVSCFDAKVTGIKLEKLGHEFLGRYNKPWEYK
jgi:rhodanese-related sulfurtransferase